MTRTITVRPVRRSARRAITLGATLAAPALAGCQGLLRENIVASTQSMIGLSVAQNPGTQMYELNAGFGRGEFFMVPTSKYVPYAEGDWRVGASERGHHDPSSTPEVLAEIQVGGKGKPGLSSDGAEVKVYQRLAVGKHAVGAPAAVALLAHDPALAAALVPMGGAEINGADRAAALRRLRELLQEVERLAPDSAEPAQERPVEAPK